MTLKDALVKKIYVSKNDEVFLTFKILREDCSPEQEQVLRLHWKEDMPLDLETKSASSSTPTS